MLEEYDPAQHWYFKKLHITPFHQEEDYTCGMWTTAAVLDFFDRDIGLQLLLDLNVTEDGTRQNNIINALRKRNISANVLYGHPIERFIKTIDEGKLVIIYDHKIDHWMLLVGYDYSSEYIIVYCPERGEFIEPFEAFEDEYNGFGIICGDKNKCKTTKYSKSYQKAL